MLLGTRKTLPKNQIFILSPSACGILSRTLIWKTCANFIKIFHPIAEIFNVECQICQNPVTNPHSPQCILKNHVFCSQILNISRRNKSKTVLKSLWWAASNREKKSLIYWLSFLRFTYLQCVHSHRI